MKCPFKISLRFLILFLSPLLSLATEKFDEKIANFKNLLSHLEPTLKASIFSLSGQHYNFFYAGEKVTPESQFYIGSVSKHITAFMLLKTLKQKNPTQDLKELLQAPLLITFLYSKLLRKIDKAWVEKISLLDLLTHYSGLSEFIDEYQYNEQKKLALNNPIESLQILQSVKFNPTKPYLYSNTNYFLIAELMEELQNDSYEQLFQKFVKEPANMMDSYAPSGGNYHSFKQDPHFKELQPNLNTEIFLDFKNAKGCGGIISTANDMAKWNHYFYTQVEPELRSIMLSNYGADKDGTSMNLGLGTEKTSVEIIGAQGEQDSYLSSIGYLPPYDLSYVILSNNYQDYKKLMSVWKKQVLE